MASASPLLASPHDWKWHPKSLPPRSRPRGGPHAAPSAIESYSYAPLDSAVHDASVAATTSWSFHRRTAMRWGLNFIIALGVALLGALVTFANKQLIQIKFNALATLIDREQDGTLPFGVALAAFVAISTCYAAAACVPTSFLEPSAAGSGISEVKSVLNGLELPRVLSVRTLFAKVFGNILSVSSGLPVGREGPMIHTGAIIGSGAARGCGMRLCCCRSAFASFRNDKEMRDFVTCGAAAGVAAAFGAPIGGVLFAIEEGASHWYRGLVWRIFFCTVVTTYILDLFLSGIDDNSEWGKLAASGMFSFGDFSTTGQNSRNWSMWEIPFFLFLGVAGGLFGALFSAVQRRLTRFRFARIPASKPWSRFWEVIVIAVTVSTLLFTMSLVPGQCKLKPTAALEAPYIAELQPLYCAHGYYNELASMFMVPSEDAIRQLFHLSEPFSWQALVIFFCIYSMLACITYGIAVPAGLFIPSLLAGSAMGRLVGELLHIYLPSTVQVDAGVYALIGAAAMLGGMTRMTISLAVILLECTGDYQFGLPLMATLLVSRFVGNAINTGIYELHIDLRGWPLLHDHPPHTTVKDLRVCDVMAKPPIVMQEVDTVAVILRVLSDTRHNAFPVVYSPGMMAAHPRLGSLAGIIQRRQLALLLSKRAFHADLPSMPFASFVEDAMPAAVAAFSISTAGVQVRSHSRSQSAAEAIVHVQSSSSLQLQRVHDSDDEEDKHRRGGNGHVAAPASIVAAMTVARTATGSVTTATAAVTSAVHTSTAATQVSSPARQSSNTSADIPERASSRTRAHFRPNASTVSATALPPLPRSRNTHVSPAASSSVPAASTVAIADALDGDSPSAPAAYRRPSQPRMPRVTSGLFGFPEVQEAPVLLRMPSVPSRSEELSPGVPPYGRSVALSQNWTSAAEEALSPSTDDDAASLVRIDLHAVTAPVVDIAAPLTLHALDSVPEGDARDDSRTRASHSTAAISMSVSHEAQASTTTAAPSASAADDAPLVSIDGNDEPTLQFVAEDDILKLLYTDEPLVRFKEFEADYPHMPDIARMRFTPQELHMYIDLRPYFSPTPHTIHVHAPVARAFELFRFLGLRHLLVVNDCHDVVGIITRHDLVDDHLERCRMLKYRKANGGGGARAFGYFPQTDDEDA